MNIGVVEEEATVDQGISFLKYQEALLVVQEGVGVFNALTILTFTAAAMNGWPMREGMPDFFMPNVTGRPVRMSFATASSLRDKAFVAYQDACKLYFQSELEVRATIKKTFEDLIETQDEDVNE